MATRFHIGAARLKSDIGAYAKRFDLLEVSLGAADDNTNPSPATLRRWRRSVPPHFAFTVVVGPDVARLKPSAALEQQLDAALEASRILEARSLLIPTPAEVTPGALWRERMVKLVARIPRDVMDVVWEPRGVWEVGDAAVAARKWKVVLAVDAAREPVPVGSVAYVRLRQLGETRGFGEAALARVVHAIGERRDAYVVLESPKALTECKRLRTIAQSARASRGAVGRIVRPRTVRVRDDEQE